MKKQTVVIAYRTFNIGRRTPHVYGPFKTEAKAHAFCDTNILNGFSYKMLTDLHDLDPEPRARGRKAK
jgi:hypothetical protein